MAIRDHAGEPGHHAHGGDAGAITAFCPTYHRAIELIGRRWTGAIVRALMSGATRFSDVRAAIPGLSDRMLSDRLKTLEQEGIVVRAVYPEVPVRIEYRLTEKGQALAGVLAAVTAWAERWLAPEPARPSADECELARRRVPGTGNAR